MYPQPNFKPLAELIWSFVPVLDEGTVLIGSRFDTHRNGVVLEFDNVLRPVISSRFIVERRTPCYVFLRPENMERDIYIKQCLIRTDTNGREYAIYTVQYYNAIDLGSVRFIIRLLCPPVKQKWIVRFPSDTVAGFDKRLFKINDEALANERVHPPSGYF